MTLASNYPYENRQGECRYTESEHKVYLGEDFKAYEAVSNREMEKLVCHGTVSVSIRINDCIKNYKSGIIYDGDGKCGCSRVKSGNHAVSIVGFGTDITNTSC